MANAGPSCVARGLAFSPFTCFSVQAYGGEAIYRVFLFSAPWCALLIASMLAKFRPAAMAAGNRLCLRRDIGRRTARLFHAGRTRRVHSTGTRSEPMAIWPCPHGSLLVLPEDNFPDLETADFNDYNLVAHSRLSANWSTDQ